MLVPAMVFVLTIACMFLGGMVNSAQANTLSTTIALVSGSTVHSQSAHINVNGIAAFDLGHVLLLVLLSACVAYVLYFKRRIQSRHDLALKGKEEQIDKLNADIDRLKWQANRESDSNKALRTELSHRTNRNLLLVQSLIKQPYDDILANQQLYDGQRQNRELQAIGLLHNKLCEDQVHNIDINLKSYIKAVVEDGCELLSDQIKVHAEIADMQAPLNVALPLGLIINELITNRALHAFPVNYHGKMEIWTRKDDQDDIMVTVKDNGLHISEKTLEESEQSFNLINGLVEKLGGRMKWFKQRHGMHVMVLMPAQIGCENELLRKNQA